MAAGSAFAPGERAGPGNVHRNALAGAGHDDETEAGVTARGPNPQGCLFQPPKAWPLRPTAGGSQEGTRSNRATVTDTVTMLSHCPHSRGSRPPAPIPRTSREPGQSQGRASCSPQTEVPW